MPEKSSPWMFSKTVKRIHDTVDQQAFTAENGQTMGR
jgi:hypothetical protein